ncbi:MAG: hypothetical protein VB046_06750 [Paludibacter sp.]|nr:hypothetical protein [Paludibacter sp.]
MDVIFVNSERVHFEQMLGEIISEQISKQIERLVSVRSDKDNSRMSSSTSPFRPAIRYNLKDPVVVDGLGFSRMGNPVRKIISELRKFGIEVDVRQRSGSYVFGSDLNHYLQQVRLSQKSYKSKKHA